MSPVSPQHDGPQARRVAIFTNREQQRGVFRAPGYELEDIIADEFEDATLIAPNTHALNQRRFKLRRWFARRGLHGETLRFGAVASDLDHEVALFFAAPAVPNDLFALTTLRDWRRKSASAICYLQELWVSEVDTQLRGILPILNQFDHVFVGLYHTAQLLRERLDVPVEYLPLAVDAEAWHPGLAQTAERIIDACAIGKMDGVTHDALVDWAAARGRYYHYTSVGNAEFAGSHRGHRANICQTLQRSKFFFTYMAKRGFGNQRASQEEFGPRYFEGAAAGAIQLGDIVDSNPAYRAHVDWEDAVIEVPFSSAQMPEILEALEAETARIAAARVRNQHHCLLRHDHLNRWDRVLAAAQLPSTPTMEARRTRLAALAADLDAPPVARRTMP